MAIAVPIGREGTRTLWRLGVNQGGTCLARTPVNILVCRRADVYLNAKKQNRHERSNQLLEQQLFHHGNLSDLD